VGYDFIVSPYFFSFQRVTDNIHDFQRIHLYKTEFTLNTSSVGIFICVWFLLNRNLKMPPSQKSLIPLTYIIAFTWIEPFMAFSGALQAYFAPQDLIALTTRQPTYTSSLHPLMTQIAGGWMLLAFNDAFTLRLTEDIRVWTALISAALLSDLLYTLSLYEGLGAEMFWNPFLWDSAGWLTFWTTVPVTILKVAFIARVGLGRAWEKRDFKED
jgi:hypothetical protein